jgi:hypothetical protein
MIDALPFPQVIELFDYWTDCPPTHLLVKAYLGYKEKPKHRRGKLNQWEQEAQSQPVLPSAEVPAYVLDAMKQHKAEAHRAR